MEKYIPIEATDRLTGLPNVTQFHPGIMDKVAGVSGPVQEFLATLKPDPNLIYLLINAMGAMEYYGSNRNGDGFPEESLRQKHNTFVTHGKVYKHHNNKPNSPSFGDILFSFYNEDMHRVELVVTINRRLAPDLAERVDNDEYLPWSMGVRVPSDKCSICKNRAKTTAAYCEHLRRPSLNSINPETGEKAFAINDIITAFFDISVVRINADKTAFTMKKVAEYAAQEKQATMVKKLPVQVQATGVTPRDLLIRASQDNMPRALVEKLSKTASLDTILSTMLGMHAMPTKMDFQNIVLYNTGNEGLAKYLENENFIFPNGQVPANMKIPTSFSDAVSDTILNEHPQIVYSKPVIIARIMCSNRLPLPIIPEKVAEHIPQLEKLGGLYQWYVKTLHTHSPYNTKLAHLLYPRNALFNKEAAMLDFMPSVSPAYFLPLTKRVTSFAIEKSGLSLKNVIQDIIRQNSFVVDKIFENIA